jgi:catechol 2,3-dioxygenase-like lactoylglutathione lyase family enzyme
MAYRLHHLHIICKDLEKMITFFTETLEAKLVRRQKFGTADGASLDLQGTIVNIRVSREDEEMLADASQSRYGYDHIGHRIAGSRIFIFGAAHGYTQSENRLF